MDLLDLELDLHVEPSAIRRSSRANQASSSSSSTPKTATRPVEKSGRSSNLTTPKSTVPGKKAVQKTVEAVKEIKEEPESSPSAQTSRVSSIERDSRSTSMDKRSRNKAKKRFSPSPDTPASKKRKMAALLKQVTTPTIRSTPAAKGTPAEKGASSAKPPKKKTVESAVATPKASKAPKILKICSAREFAKGIAELKEDYKKSEPVDYELPEEMKSDKPSERVIQIIRAAHARRIKTSTGNTTDSTVAPKTPVAPKVENATENEEVSKKTKEEPTEKRGKGRPKRIQTPKTKAQKDLEEGETNLNPNRQSDSDESEDEPEETKKSPKKLVASSSQRRMSARQMKNNSEAVEAEEDIPLNPNSALAIKQRLLSSGASVRRPGRKSKKAEEQREPEDEPKEDPKSPIKSPTKKPPVNTPIITTATALPTLVSKTQGPTPRSSGRVSKPNRLYADQTFNTEMLGRKTVTEQNEVLEAIARDTTPDPEPPVPSTSTMPRPATVPKKRPVHREYVPKPVSLLNGVIRGYVASVKVPLEDIEVDGVVEKLNDTVNEVMDRVLLEVCGDGVQQHENIDPAVVKAKRIAKTYQTKKLKSEAKKLDIQMKFSAAIPSTTEEIGKRKRHAPKTDDMYWTPAEKWIKAGGAKGEHRKEGGADVGEQLDSTEPTPEPEEIGRREGKREEKRQQAARQSISVLFDSEIEQSIREASRFTVPFEKYMRPKIAKAQKKVGIRLMSTKRKTSYSDDFYYHELLSEEPQPSSISPTLSNVENVDVDGLDEYQEEDKFDNDKQIQSIDEPISQETAISIRTDALDIAEQIAVLIPRPTSSDGSEVTLQELLDRTVEQTESRRATLGVAMDIVVDQLAHETAPPPADIEERGCVWNTITQMNAQKLKDAFTICSTDREDAVVWAHQFLVESLPVHMLGTYLSVLRYARRINPGRFAYIITFTAEIDDEWSQATQLLKSFVYKRLVDPGAEVITSTVPYRRMTDTVFLLVSPTMTFGGPSRPALQQSRQHAHLFKWLQAIGHPDSEMIGFSGEQDLSVAEYLSDMVIDTICNKVREKRRDLPNSKVVLVGYGASTYLVHRAANLVKGIWSIISIGFPVMTKFGRRGTADDEILLTYCPTLFVVGAEGRRFNNEALTELRSSMMTASGLVIVGHANDHLLVPSPVLVRLGISQRIVFRMILEKILDFLSLEKISEQNVADLKPMALNNVYDMDSSLLKSEKALSGLAFANSSSPATLGSSGRRATVSGADDGSRKKKIDPPQPTSSTLSGTTSSSQPSPLSSLIFPSRIPMPPPSPAAQGHFQSFQTLMAQSVSTGIDEMPRRASMGASPRVVERGDFKDRAAALAAYRPVVPRPPSSQAKGPVDPASISLN